MIKEINSNKDFGGLPFLRVSKPFLQKYGLDAAVIIAEMIYWQSQMIRKTYVIANGGYFYYEMFKIEKATGITPHRQKNAMDVLCKAGILDVKSEKKGIPPKRLYKVNVRAYEKEVTKIDSENRLYTEDLMSETVKLDNSTNDEDDKSSSDKQPVKKYGDYYAYDRYGNKIEMYDED
jgi:hypothetical protein